MNTNQLKYFVSVAEHKSFTKAAKEHYLSQAAITQQIRALEENMGVQLFTRNTRPVALTPAGSVFLVEAKAILERMDTAFSRVREASTGLVGSLRIGYTKGYERSELTKKLRSFHQEYPNILLTCFRRDTDMLAAGILSGEYDIIFTWDSTNLRATKGVEYQLIERAPLVVALYASHPLAHRKARYRKELKGETILDMSPSSTGYSSGDDYFLDLYQKAGYQPNILLRSSDIESILMMVAAEVGISILPGYCANRLASPDSLVFIPLLGEEETEDILAFWRRDDPSQALTHFVAELKER